MRKSGILMHISSLPGPWGIGTMGKQAYEFVDFLQAAGQSYWQILPLSPTGYGDSPYQAFSTFAGNHYLIDPELLRQQGLLTDAELAIFHWGSGHRVDYGKLYEDREKLLQLAYRRFQPDEGYAEFVKKNEWWLKDYALFVALKRKFGGQSWSNWTLGLMMRIDASLQAYHREMTDVISFHCFLQYQFHLQWRELKQYANERGIRIIGDVPIYVPLDSADVWANPELFQLDINRRPKMVAGCPPDSFSADGQLWGNPLYNWEKMKATGYQWWIQRLAAAAELYDVVRLDHFRGFESYWAIPARDRTAVGGCWMPGPGMDFIGAVKQALPDTQFIAEDLGYVTPEVRQLQLDSGYPGMKVLEFAFDSREEGNYLPHLYPVNSVCYTGTHDNVTLKQWFDEAGEADVAEARAYLGLHEAEGDVWGMIRGAMSSISRLCVVQMQDYLELGREGRMNQPGTLSNQNWTWRAADGFASAELAQKIRRITQRYGRLPSACNTDSK